MGKKFKFTATTTFNLPYKNENGRWVVAGIPLRFIAAFVKIDNIDGVIDDKVIFFRHCMF